MNEATESLRESVATTPEASARSVGGGERELAEHLERIPGWSGKWALWKWVGMRGAGFAAQGVLALGSHESARAADELLRAEAEAEELWEDALGAVRAQLDTTTGLRRELFVKAMRQLNKGKVPQLTGLQEDADADDSLPDVLTKIKEFEAAYKRVTERGTVFEQRYADELQRNSEALRAAVSDERFREAIIWQNRRALHTGINSLLHKPLTTTSSKYRRHQELAANYLQRYCTKNDSIGFFGPVGWARLDSKRQDIGVRPGASLLAGREVYFECWCVDALCERIAEDERLRPWFVPRRLPSVRLEGETLHLPLQEPRQLSACEASVLSACDGIRTAKSIASELLGSAAGTLRDEQHIYDLLAQLEQMRLLVWKLEVADDPHAEVMLRELLERVTDNDARERALGVLEKLEGARRGVVEAAGDAERLDSALELMEEIFTAETGREATRHAGKVYAARTLLYEDCRRDIEVEVGRDMLESLGGALGLLLESARWMVAEIREEYRRELHRLYLQLARRSGETAVEATTFWLHAQPLLGKKQSALIDGAAKRFQEKWARVLPVDSEARRVRYSSEELRALVETEFAATKAGWQYARYHSPDVMIAAESIEAIRRGDYQFVLGEVHPAKNTLTSLALLMQHPQPEEVRNALNIDMPLPNVIPVYPKDEQNPIRTKPSHDLPKDFYLEHSGGAPGVPARGALTTSMLVVEASGSDLFVRTRDHRLRFDIIEFFGDILSAIVVTKFKLFEAREHQPRVTIDRLVVQRESWTFPAAEIAFAHEHEDADRFLEARRFQQQHGMPRHVFAKVPVEVKPVYVDFESALYVNMFGRLIRRSMEAGGDEAQVTISEMLPGMEQLWLPDAEGNRYTSEFRFVALDLAM